MPVVHSKFRVANHEIVAIGLQARHITLPKNFCTASQRTLVEFGNHDGARGDADVEGGVLLRVGGRYDGHEVIAISRVYLITTTTSSA